MLLTSVVDLLFIGDGTYYGHADASTMLFIHSLEPHMVKNVAIFATCGDMMHIGDTLKSQVEKRGINVIGEPFVCKGKAWNRINKSHPNKKDIANVQEYARKIYIEFAAGNE